MDNFRGDYMLAMIRIDKMKKRIDKQENEKAQLRRQLGKERLRNRLLEKRIADVRKSDRKEV